MSTQRRLRRRVRRAKETAAKQVIAFVKAKHQQTCGMGVRGSLIDQMNPKQYVCSKPKGHTGPCEDVHEGVQWSYSR